MNRIFIVEDDDSTIELLKYIVSKAGYDVDTAMDGQTGIDKIKANPPDLVLLDIMLPELHGFSVCHQIKSDDKYKHIKVLMLSAKTFPADRRQAESVGADGFLGKPVDAGELIRNIKKLLS